jgi:membrane-associated phospholipid phosphatase
VATVLASEYRETGWVPVAAYTIAAGTALSRIYIDKHWASDVFAGAVFGYACGRFIWKHNRGITIIPSLSHNVSSCSFIISIK